MRTIFYMALIVMLATGCGTSAYIEKSWRDPDVSVDMSNLNKVLVVALLRNETNRRATEDRLVEMLNGKGVASYDYLTKDIREENEANIKQRLKDEGFDGVIVMRLADVDKEVNYVPGTFSTYPPYYGRFWPYYWRFYNDFYQPGYYETTKTYRVETNVYSLTRDKLVWSGVTRSVDPENADALMNATAKAVYKQMRSEGFIRS